MASSRSHTTEAHYQAHSTETYESAYFYEPGAYTEYLKELVQGRLGLKQELLLPRTLLDVGGGTGNFTKMLVQNVNPHTKAIVVDPFLVANADDKTASNDETEKQIRFVCAPAQVFMKESNDEQDAWWRRNYHQVLLKEVVHHIDDSSERVAIFRGLHRGLEQMVGQDLPSLLIITRPQTDIDYPLWPEAKLVWAKHQPSAESLIHELKNAGFTKVEQSMEAYPCSVLLQRWLNMVKQRFWSTFSSFTDDELHDACQLVSASNVDRIDENGCIHFEDRLVFLAAYK